MAAMYFLTQCSNLTLRLQFALLRQRTIPFTRRQLPWVAFKRLTDRAYKEDKSRLSQSRKFQQLPSGMSPTNLVGQARPLIATSATLVRKG